MSTFQSLRQKYFDRIAHNFRQFCKGVKIFQFSSEIILGNFYRHLATFYWSNCTTMWPTRRGKNDKTQIKKSFFFRISHLNCSAANERLATGKRRMKEQTAKLARCSVTRCSARISPITISVSLNSCPGIYYLKK